MHKQSGVSVQGLEYKLHTMRIQHLRVSSSDISAEKEIIGAIAPPYGDYVRLVLTEQQSLLRRPRMGQAAFITQTKPIPLSENGNAKQLKQLIIKGRSIRLEEAKRSVGYNESLSPTVPSQLCAGRKSLKFSKSTSSTRQACFGRYRSALSPDPTKPTLCGCAHSAITMASCSVPLSRRKALRLLLLFTSKQQWIIVGTATNEAPTLSIASHIRKS
jgi:hypothetical protein